MQLTIGQAFDLQTNLAAPVLQGLFQGCAYGLLGLGIVLLYKSNRIFNFAQGEFAAVAALVSAAVLKRTGTNLSGYLLAALVGTAVGVTIALLTERLVIRPLFTRPRVTLVVATVGVALLLLNIETIAAGSAQTVPSFDRVLGLKPGGVVTVLSYHVQAQDLLNAGTLTVLTVLLAGFFRYTATGTAILAVSQEPTAAGVVGISVSRVSLITWGIAGFLGSIAGLLFAPVSATLGPGFVTGTALVVTLVAAVFGGITSLPGAVVGGLSIGVLQALVVADKGEVPALSIPNPDFVVIGVVLLAVLVVRPKGLLGTST